MSTSRIAQLSSLIHDKTKAFDASLAAAGIPSPTLEQNVSTQIPKDALEARDAVLAATDELAALVGGPKDVLDRCVFPDSTSIHAVCRFNICIPTGKTEATYLEIAEACGRSEAEVRGFLRYLMTVYIFQEIRPGVVAHTAASRLLTSDFAIRQYMHFMAQEIAMGRSRKIDAMSRWPGSQEPHETGFSLAHNTDLSLWDHLATDPRAAKRFATTMDVFKAGPGWEPFHVVDNWPFEKLGAATLVDIGGSHGFMCVAIAERAPKLKFVVQDRPEVVCDGPDHVPAELSDRVTFMEHDFLKEQPVKGADVYFLRWILHDWSDKYAMQILRSLIPALKKGARVVVVDAIMPEWGFLPRLRERDLRIFDLTMGSMFNAKERELDDWKQLFAEADARFKLESAVLPPGSRLGILELSWNPDTGANGHEPNQESA